MQKLPPIPISTLVPGYLGENLIKINTVVRESSIEGQWDLCRGGSPLLAAKDV